MSIWRAVRDETAGAWRSLKYDLRRRAAGDAHTEPVYPEYDAFAGGPRRIIVASGMAALVLGGAAGGYLGVVHGLGGLLAPQAAPPAEPVPAAAAPTRAPARAAAPSPRPTRPGTKVIVVQPGSPRSVTANRAAPARPPVPTPAPSCACDLPPAPAPTSPGPTPSPDVTSSPSASPSPAPSTSPSDSGH